MENRSLWYKVLMARYGEVGGSIAEGGRFNSVWWNNLITMRRGTGVEVGRWIDDNICRDVGDGNNTLFLVGSWIDGVVFKNTFSRLFYLSINKMATVTEMYALGWGRRGSLAMTV